MDSILAPTGEWPTLKNAIDVLRAFPILGIVGAGLNSISRNPDMLSQITLWFVGPILVVLVFCATIQLAALIFILAVGILSHVPGTKFIVTAARQKEIIKFFAPFLEPISKLPEQQKYRRNLYKSEEILGM